MFEGLQEFVCQMYGGRGATSVNELRYQIMWHKQGKVESSQLPPCADCLYKHSLRANYQAAVWKRCLNATPDIPTFIGRGWIASGTDDIDIDWMDGPVGPDAVLEFIACKCTRQCKVPTCICLENGLKCTDMCKLAGCDNQNAPDTTEELTEDTIDLDIDDDYDFEQDPTDD